MRTERFRYTRQYSYTDAPSDGLYKGVGASGRRRKHARGGLHGRRYIIPEKRGF